MWLFQQNTQKVAPEEEPHLPPPPPPRPHLKDERPNGQLRPHQELQSAVGAQLQEGEPASQNENVAENSGK